MRLQRVENTVPCHTSLNLGYYFKCFFFKVVSPASQELPVQVRLGGLLVPRVCVHLPGAAIPSKCHHSLLFLHGLWKSSLCVCIDRTLSLLLCNLYCIYRCVIFIPLLYFGAVTALYLEWQLYTIRLFQWCLKM